MDSIREFVLRRLRRHGDEKPAEGDESLFVSGRLDSMDAMETILFLEQEFGLDLSQLAFSLELIDSIEKIGRLTTHQQVAQKSQTGPDAVG